MQDLIKQEQFELEVLDLFKSRRILEKLLFCGGTMLRLCYELNRYSVDLDFWIPQSIDREILYHDIHSALSRKYEITDTAQKLHTLLFEIPHTQFPRRLKIEIRSIEKDIVPESAIAYSSHVARQVMVSAVPLKDVMASKIEALINRKEIRDAFDIEFLVKRGISLPVDPKKIAAALRVIDSFKKLDYAQKLGSLLDVPEREYYRTKGFVILRSALKEAIVK